MAHSPNKTWNWNRLSVPQTVQDAPVAQVLDGRYALKEPLGTGAQGQVLRALNLATGEMVAIKVMSCPSLAHRERARQEIMALRLVDSPFVVKLLDHGEHEQWVYAVMGLVEGEPLPPAPVPWVQLRPLFCNLLRGIQSLHNQGLIHRDLKPDNVMINAEGLPVLLDLGLSAGRSMHGIGHAGSLEGTPRYASPEQFRGEPCTPQSDLYSLGVMLYELLSGSAPHPGDPREIEAARLGSEAPVLGPRPGLPEPIALLCHAMLERDPKLRPPSADTILRILGEQDNAARVSELCAALPERSTPQALETLFGGQKAYLHLPDDAARALYAQTGGYRDAVRATLLDWLNQGIATQAEGRFHLTRAKLSRLKFSQDIRGRQDHRSLKRLMERTAFLIDFQAKAEEGKEWARQTCQLALDLGDVEQARRAMEWLTYAQMTRQTRVGERETLLDLERAERQGVFVEDLCWLVQGQQQLLRGERERAKASLEQVGPFSLLALERNRRATLLWSISNDPEALRTALHTAEIEAWARTSTKARRALYSWRGNLAWREGRWREAQSLKRRAAQLARQRFARNALLHFASDSALESQDWAFFLSVNPLLLRQAAANRVSGQEIRQLALQAKYFQRSDLSAGPTNLNLEHATSVDPQAAISLALYEAALCWRRGTDLEQARAHVAFIARLTPRLAYKAIPMLARALGGLLGLPLDPEELLEETRSTSLIPEMKIQLTGVVSALRGRPSPELLPDLTRYRHQRPIDWHQVRDLCSPAEAEHAIVHGHFPPLSPESTHAHPHLPRFL